MTTKTEAPATNKQRITFTATFHPGKRAEYIKAHQEVWPGLRELMDEGGLRNYTIWATEDRIFGYYEAEYGLEHFRKVWHASPLTAKWAAIMKDMIEIQLDPATGKPAVLEQIFLHEPGMR